MAGPVADILMYHSVSDAGGPTSIPPAVFRDQMAALAGSGVPVLSLDALLAARRGGPPLPARSVILTFDDGFEDFARCAWPEIARRGWSATVFLPAARMGGVEDWRGAARPARPLMSRATVAALAEEGAGFGGHSLGHPDLVGLDDAALEAEIAGSRAAVEDMTGRPAPHFAPPYGRADARVRRAIARHFATSCGTALGRAGPGADLHDLPRLEMFYYRDPGRWRAHLAGRGGAYLALRRGLRAVRERVSMPWERG